MDGASSTVTSGTADVVDRMYSAASGGFGASGAVAAGVLVLLIVVAVVYTCYVFAKTSLTTVTLLADVTSLGTSVPTVAKSQLPTPVGREFSVSLWVYIEAVAPSASYQRLVGFGNSGNGDERLGVYLDRSTGMAFVVLKLININGGAADTALSAASTASAVLSSAAMSDVNTDGTFKTAAGTRPWLVAPIEYIPQNRWVNIMVSVDNSVMSVYMDGDIYGVASSDHFANLAGGVAADPKADVYIGGVTATGYMSKVQYCNYALSVYHARAIYDQGPASNWILSSLGLSNIKFQWPVASASAVST
jgi:hypothetical protein